MGNSFKENLREELEFNGISIKDLSVQTKIPRRSIDNYLNSRSSMPPADYACRIAKVLNTTVEKLVGGNQAPVKNEKESQNAKIIYLLNQAKSEDKKAILQLLTTITSKQEVIFRARLWSGCEVFL